MVGYGSRGHAKGAWSRRRTALPDKKCEGLKQREGEFVASTVFAGSGIVDQLKARPLFFYSSLEEPPMNGGELEQHLLESPRRLSWAVAGVIACLSHAPAAPALVDPRTPSITTSFARSPAPHAPPAERRYGGLREVDMPSTAAATAAEYVDTQGAHGRRGLPAWIPWPAGQAAGGHPHRPASGGQYPARRARLAADISGLQSPRTRGRVPRAMACLPRSGPGIQAMSLWDLVGDLQPPPCTAPRASSALDAPSVTNQS